MLIDPFTTIAQIINFLILVALLKRFLYGPITQAMTERENRIAERLQHAAAKEADAEAEAAHYHELQQQFQDQEEERYAHLLAQVEAKRSALLAEAEQAVAATRHQWYDELCQEKQSFLRLLWQQSSQQLADVTRRTLLDLANADLEQQVVARFLDRLQALSPLEQQSLQAALTDDYDGPGIVISSSFPLDKRQRRRLVEAVQQQMPAVHPGPQITFKTQEAILCGVELQASGYKLSWNLAQYLKQLDNHLGQLLDQRRPTAPFLK